MIRLLIAGLLLVSVNTVADTQVTHTFRDGTSANAAEVNTNFDDLEAAIDTVLSSTTTEDIALTAIGQGDIRLTTNGGTPETIVLTNKQGNSDASIALTSTQGGITLSADTVLKLNSGTRGLITNRAVQTIVDSATEATAVQYVAGFINVTGGKDDAAFTLPKGADLADAMLGTVAIGDSFICYVVNGSGSDIKYYPGASGSTLSAVGGILQQKAGSMAKLEFIFTVATGGSEEYYVLLHADNP